MSPLFSFHRFLIIPFFRRAHQLENMLTVVLNDSDFINNFSNLVCPLPMLVFEPDVLTNASSLFPAKPAVQLSSLEAVELSTYIFTFHNLDSRVAWI